MILGDSAPAYMTEMVRVNMDRIRDTGFTPKLWRDDDVEHLVAAYGDPELSQAWQYVKEDMLSSRLAKRADFLRPLIMYMEGGVYLDTDMVPCVPLDLFIDDPHVVTFPFLYHNSREVNGAAMSSPPGHPLMKKALDAFIELGPDITTLHNLYAAGPVKMALITEDYLRTEGIDIPPVFSDTEYNPYIDAPEVTSHYGIWTQIADIRFTHPSVDNNFPVYHLHFGSWIPHWQAHTENENICSEKPELIAGFIEWMCKPDIRNHAMRYDRCGHHLDDSK